MQDDEIILTPAKRAELEAEVERLTTQERPAIAERIRQARSLGDLSENFDYHDAKRQQGFLEGKIINLKNMLDRAKIVDYISGGDIVTLGSRVRVWDEQFEEEVEYTIVGVLDADPANDKISNTSPVGKALLKHKVGDTVEVQTPEGKDLYIIREIL